MAVLTKWRGTPSGRGLIRYAARGGETVRVATSYPASLVTPVTASYVTGDTVEVYLDWGYTNLSHTDTDRNQGNYRTIQANATLSRISSVRTHKLEFSFVSDVRPTSDLAALENLQTAGIYGSTIFWYPDYDNNPNDYVACTITKRNEPMRNGSYHTVVLQLDEVATTETPAVYFPATQQALNTQTAFSVQNRSQSLRTLDTVKFGVGAFVRVNVDASGGSNFLAYLFVNTIGPSSFVYLGSYQEVATGKMHVYVSYDGSLANSTGVVSDVAVDLTTWKYVWVEYDGSQTNEIDRIRINVDNIFLSTTLESFNLTAIPTSISSGQQTLLYLSNTTNNGTRGDVDFDDVVFYNGTLPTDYVIIRGTAPAVDISSEPGLVDWWRLEGDFSNEIDPANPMQGDSNFITDVPV